MISPEEGTGEGLSAMETIARYNEPFLRERRIDTAHRELVSMSTEGDCHACAAPAAHAGQSLGLSNCHISTAAPLPDETACLGAFAEREEAEQEVP